MGAERYRAIRREPREGWGSMSRNVNEFDWNEAKVDQLRQMVEDGYTGGQIAKAWGFSRSTIQGKITRLGLKRGAPSDLVKMAATVHDTKRKSRAKAPSEPKPKHKPLPTLAEMKAPRPMPKDEPITETAVATIDLEAHHCRWPITAGSPFKHCGAPRIAGRQYCAAHVAKAFSGGTKSERSAA